MSINPGKGASFDKLDKVLQGKDGIKNLRWLLTLLINEGADDGEPELSEKAVGRMIHTGNFGEVKTAIFKAFAIGNSGTAEPPAEDDDSDNEDDDSDNEDQKNASAGKG